MRILYYYWCQFDDDTQPGGGVKVYLRNIINDLKNRKDVEIYTLNSGVDYDLSGKLHIEKIPAKDNIYRFKIVNSPIASPSKCAFFENEKYLTDEFLKNLLRDFLKKQGPFDVVHIQSIEGLGIKCLELKEEFPDTKLILSIHNYHYFCPQVNLWKWNKENCTDFHDGKDCCTCMGRFPSSDKIKKFYLFSSCMKKWGIHVDINQLKNKARSVLGYSKSAVIDDKVASAMPHYDFSLFKKFRETNAAYINRYADAVLCVSKRVKWIAEKMGVDPEILHTSYIGSDFTLHAKEKPAYPIDSEYFKIAYMGYMRRDKGLYFLIDALEKLSIDYAKKIDFVVAARYEDQALLGRIKGLANRFHKIETLNGYTRKDIVNITNHLNLGVVPIMWEDCLPQVAIEFKAMGIPVLGSKLGGVAELSSAAEFSFEAGNIKDFNDHLMNLMDHRDLLSKYYEKHLKLRTMKEHCDELVSYYTE